MERFLSRTAASAAVGEQGWRYLIGTLRTSVAVGSLAEATAVAARVVEACGADADEHLRLDLRPKLVSLILRPQAFGGVTIRDTELARSITAALRAVGLETTPGADPAVRPVQEWEVAIDALDIGAVRPFWKAVLGYTDEPGKHGAEDRLVDPLRQGPAVWFQRMSEPRPQRNCVHFDICVPHDEAPGRLAAALAAGGRLVSEERAPSFWVLADYEGNEVCITTWQGRDP
ncbi:VOC family protein [Actinoplanes sp. NPDC023801]|uniref:VOC family protein n=1 Tax=Actinoplanes sp. NPDC023801 TaxID=3154595 RepID=UPI0033CA8312